MVFHPARLMEQGLIFDNKKPVLTPDSTVSVQVYIFTVGQ